MKEITLNFNGQSITVAPNEAGMYNLNEIARGFSLRLPSQWRNAQRNAMEQNANLHSAQVIGDVNQHRALFATQTGLYAYAIWCDPTQQFFVSVVECFTAVTNGDLEGAVEIASEVVQVREGLRQSNAELSTTMVDHYSNLMRRAGQYEHYAASVHRMVYKLATNTRMPSKVKVRSPRDQLLTEGNSVALYRMTALYERYSVFAEEGLEYQEIKSKLEAHVDKKGWFEKRIK